ncbi:MAG: methylated-DNA--[protein]-cysteine S-methyltransferase [Proteobacteria bacterium]|nr:methylated-DNA--[protein]-cysteine S-methyltransferase [Pseudomonadota bacterium]
MKSILDQARAFLDARGGERVTLAELARVVGASPWHLQRRFKHAFGVSPLAYQEARRLEATKTGLRKGARVTDAVFDAGYGSLSRFYEKAGARLGMDARAYRARGEGQRIVWTSFDSPLGKVLVAATPRGVCAVKLGGGVRALRAALAEEFGRAALIEDDASLGGVRKRVLAFLKGDDALTRVPLDVRGTVFQRRVWEALRAIPRGETRTYGELASSIGRPKAVRAVGSACAANPVALAVPCHRALRADGGLGGYAWGLPRKKTLLENEKRRRG